MQPGHIVSLARTLELWFRRGALYASSPLGSEDRPGDHRRSERPDAGSEEADGLTRANKAKTVPKKWSFRVSDDNP